MRLIDADALKARIIEDVPGFFDNGSSITKAFILAMLETRSATPTIDAVPIVRCKDCKHFNAMKCSDPERGTCDLWHMLHLGEWFCADGEKLIRKE